MTRFGLLGYYEHSLARTRSRPLVVERSGYAGALVRVLTVLTAGAHHLGKRP